MKIPEFKPSRRFLGEYAIPCLVGKVKNSELRGIATRHIAEFKTDPECVIYLRGKDPKNISAWQKEILEQLFAKEGLAAAVAEGLKELEAEYGSKCYVGYDEEELQHIKEHGYLPFLWISYMVIDEIEQRVVIRPDDNAGPLHEHEATIYLSEGRWRFENDHLVSYEGHIDEMVQVQEEQKLKKKYGRMFPSPEDGTPANSDASRLFGLWRYDQAETVKLRKQLKAPQDDIKRAMNPTSHLLKTGLFFSPTKLGETCENQLSEEYDVLGCEHKGNWFRVKQESVFLGVLVFDYWCDGKLLVWPNNDVVFSHVKDSYQEGYFPPRPEWLERKISGEKERLEKMALMDLKRARSA